MTRSKKRRPPAPWCLVEPGFWWCPYVGSASLCKDGWWASGSGYKGVVLKPSFGPHKTAEEAIFAFLESQRPERLPGGSET